MPGGLESSTTHDCASPVRLSANPAGDCACETNVVLRTTAAIPMRSLRMTAPVWILCQRVRRDPGNRAGSLKLSDLFSAWRVYNAGTLARRPAIDSNRRASPSTPPAWRLSGAFNSRAAGVERYTDDAPRRLSSLRVSVPAILDSWSSQSPHRVAEEKRHVGYRC